MNNMIVASLVPVLAGIVIGSSSANAQSTTTVKFAAFGDYGNGPGANSVATFTKSKLPNIIITLGDNCYTSTPPIATQVGSKYQTYVTAKTFFPSLGNHEFSDGCGGGSTAQGYRAYFTLPSTNERYYDFKRGPVHFFALNSATEPDGKSATSKQAMWLKAKLAASTSPWQVVYFHHPPYSSGYHKSQTYMRWPFEQWGVDAVLAGHDHNYERVMIDGNKDGIKIPYLVNGLGGTTRRAMSSTIVPGSVKRYTSNYGIILATATTTSVKFEFRSVSNTLIDTYTITKKTPYDPFSTALEFRVVQ